ncbi:MAG: hypothetical protein WC325_08470 [Candidatus Bathyarchaeia archaeon]|jgi:hypothetical protein
MSASNSTAIQYSLSLNTELAHKDIRQLETVLMRTLNYVQMFTGGDPNITKAINLAQAAITTYRTLEMAIRAAQAALIPGAGLIKLAYAATSFIAVGMSGYSAYESLIGS